MLPHYDGCLTHFSDGISNKRELSILSFKSWISKSVLIFLWVNLESKSDLSCFVSIILSGDLLAKWYYSAAINAFVWLGSQISQLARVCELQKKQMHISNDIFFLKIIIKCFQTPLESWFISWISCYVSDVCSSNVKQQIQYRRYVNSQKCIQHNSLLSPWQYDIIAVVDKIWIAVVVYDMRIF